MKALDPGTKAPKVELPLLGGGSFSLSETLSQGSVLLAFFKISCPVCQYAFPYIDRLAKRVSASGLKVIGVSQDDAKSTDLFRKEFGIGFPLVLDEPGKYPVSNAYGLTNVPTLFLVGEDGNIEQTIVSWSKSELEDIDKAYRDGRNASSPLFAATEQVADFRAG